MIARIAVDIVELDRVARCRVQERGPPQRHQRVVDITDCALGSAFGSLVPDGSLIVTSRDSTRSSRMIKRAMMASLLSVGCEVMDMRSSPVPVTVDCTLQIDGNSVTVTVPITDELSALFEGTTSESNPNYVYQIVVTKGGRRHTLALGSAIVRKKVG